MFDYPETRYPSARGSTSATKGLATGRLTCFVAALLSQIAVDLQPMDRKLVLVTGADSGLGFAASERYTIALGLRGQTVQAVSIKRDLKRVFDYRERAVAERRQPEPADT